MDMRRDLPDVRPRSLPKTKNGTRRSGDDSQVAAVELRGLTKIYGVQTVVDRVSLLIEHGQMVCLLGPSGCGKTTTLRLIAGFMEPTAGKIRVGDRIVSSPARTLPPEQRNMSMIFQSYALWPHMTVAENVAYGLRLRKMDNATIAAKLGAILASTHLEALAARYPGELSGGQQQRVSLARALVIEPETLLLDEPLSNLDANLREEMRFEIRRLHDAFRYTTVYVTHDQAEAMTTADLIAVMNAGRIEQLGTPEEIYDRPRSEFVARFIGASNVIKGQPRDAHTIELAGQAIACSGEPMTTARPVAVSIRPHNVILLTGAPPAGILNVVPATITRHVFLGSLRDYVARLADGTELRVTAPPSQNIPTGTAVHVHLPQHHCLALAG
jgi:iron(III) transport system ATP-binding protein